MKRVLGEEWKAEKAKEQILDCTKRKSKGEEHNLLTTNRKSMQHALYSCCIVS